MNFVVVKGTQANAFSVPGGWVYVNEALLKNAGNETELANVVGHETGHIVSGHVMDRLHKAQTLNTILSIASIFVHTQGAANTFNLAQFAAGYGFLNFSRQQEYQADHEGVILASKAGYNPWGMIWFFQKLEKLYGDSGFEQYVQDHPSTKDRIARIESFFQSDPTEFARWSSTLDRHAGSAALIWFRRATHAQGRVIRRKDVNNKTGGLLGRLFRLYLVLLDFDGRALLFELGLDRRGFVLGDAGLHRFGSAFDQVFGFLEAKPETTSRTTLMTLIFFSPALMRCTSNSVFASAPARGRAACGRCGDHATGAAAETPNLSSSVLTSSCSSSTVSLSI